MRTLSIRTLAAVCVGVVALAACIDESAGYSARVRSLSIDNGVMCLKDDELSHTDYPDRTRCRR
jgi:hypothetical protein